MKRVIFVFAVAVLGIAGPAHANGNVKTCADTDLAHYVNNYGTCENGSWVSVRIDQTCVSTLIPSFSC
jgi:hypothetical protein